jgi:hypothetical protein
VIRLRAIYHDKTRKEEYPSQERCGTLADLEAWAARLSKLGYNIYLLARLIHRISGIRWRM